MCFYVRTNHEQEQTAKEDITVYKIIFRGDNASIYRGFVYTPNTSYRLRKKLKIDCGIIDTIDKGFHSYAIKFPVSSSTRKLVKFIIPRGAKYYYDPVNKEYVSSSIRSDDLVAI